MDEAALTYKFCRSQRPACRTLNLTKPWNWRDWRMTELRRWCTIRLDRFHGFATLPTPNPKEAERELERAVGELR